MQIFVNKWIPAELVGWKFSSNKQSKRLFLFNHTGRAGHRFENTWLSFNRKGRSYYINLNKPKKAPSTKTVGIFISESGTFQGWESGTEIFSGKSIGGLVTGYFGIFKLGAVVQDVGLYYKLTETGWELNDHANEEQMWRHPNGNKDW